MAPRYRRAFTLVEVLVVIVIISMLVALLVPAVVGARARARQANCLNNQSQVAKAILQYESAKQQLPGYVNSLGSSETKSRLGMNLGGSLSRVPNLSWVVVIFEELGHADIWKEWRVNNPNRPVVTIPEVICPSDALKSGKPGQLSLAVNCGISDFQMVPKYSDDALEYKDKTGIGVQAAPWGSSSVAIRLAVGYRPTSSRWLWRSMASLMGLRRQSWCRRTLTRRCGTRETAPTAKSCKAMWESSGGPTQPLSRGRPTRIS